VLRRTLALVLGSACVLATGASSASCAPPRPPETGHYARPTAWLCLPGRDDACARDLTATEIHADGTRSVERFVPAADPKADCFYVYPTVDLNLIPKNHEDFSDLEPMSRVTVAQAARFRETCALYVPLYRQVTIGAYLRPPDDLEPRLAAAFADVEAAFAEYLARHDRGRPLVLLGHSQGAEMIVRLLKRFFDDPESPSAAALRARLLVALVIGGNVEAPSDRKTGGTFATVPFCTADDERGCVVAYRTHAAGVDVVAGRNAPKAPGDTTVCVNPADIAGNAERPLSRSYLPLDGLARRRMRGVEDIKTPFVVLRDLYAGRCMQIDGGYRFFSVVAPAHAGDARTSPLDLDRVPFQRALGLHLLDFQLPQGDLLSLVAKRVAAADPPTSPPPK
jgi:hypothetical protein